MNARDLCSLNGRPSRRIATAKAWQIVLIGACSLVASTRSVLCSEQFKDNQLRATPSNVVSYANQHRQYRQQASSENQYITQNSNRAADLASASMNVQQQPSVYHSVIDATNTRQSALSPVVQTSSSTIGDLHASAGHHHGLAHGKYYEYRAVPKKKTWKFGYKRGNHKHTISRHEYGKAGKHPHFKTKVKWNDSKSKGKGIHLWDYNHHDKKHYYHG